MSSALAEFSCGVCKEQFSHNSQDEKAPINGICSHKVCRDCVQKMHVAANTKPSGTFVKNLKCPICKQEKSFRADNLIVDVEFCRALKAIEALLPKRGNGDNSDNDNGTDHQHEENPTSTAGVDAKAKGEDVKVKTKPETDVTKPGGTGDLRIKKKKEESEECSEEAECSKSKPNQEIPDNNIDCEASSNPNEVALSSSVSRRSSRHRMQTNYYGLGVSIDDEGKNGAASPNNDDKPSTKSNAKASTEASTSSRHLDLQIQTDRCDQGVSLKDREMSDRSLPLSPVTSPNIYNEAYVDSTAIESTRTATSSTSRRSGRSRVRTDRHGPGLRLEDEERRDPSLMISPDASPITGVEAATNSNAMVTIDATTTPKRPPRRRIQTKYYRPGMSLDGTRDAGPDSLQSSIDGSKHSESGVVTPINKRKRARFEESGSESGSDYKDETESKSFIDNTLRNSKSKEVTPIDTIKRMRSKESEFESDSVFDSDADSDSDSEEDSGEDSDSESEEDSGEDSGSDSEEDSGEDSGSDSEEDEAKSKTSKDDTCQNLGIYTISRNGYEGNNPEGEGQINPAVVAIKQEYDGVHQHHQTLALNNRQYGDRVLLARQKKNGIMKLGGGNCGMLVYPSQKDAAKRNHPRFHDVGDRKGMCYDISWQRNAPKWAGFPSGDVKCVPKDIEPGEPFSVFVKHLMKNVTVGWEYLGEYRETNPREDMTVWGDVTALSILDKRKMVGDILKSAKREGGWGKTCINDWKVRLNMELERDKSAASAEKTATLSARARNLGYQENMTNAEVANVIVNLDEFHSAVGISFVEYNEKVYDYIKGGETSRNAQGKIRKNRESCMKASDWYDYYDKQCKK